MSDAQEFEIEPASTAPPKRDAISQTIASARERLTRFLPRAIEILEELAELSENDRVRLAAVESIADRVGLVRGAMVNADATQSEHDIAEQETATLLRRIQENQDEIAAPKPDISIDALIVHEGEDVHAEPHGETA